MDERSAEDDEEGSLNEDPVLGATLIAELERVLGPLGESVAKDSFQWILPVAGINEMLDLLREAPTGLGVAGFEQLLRGRFGSLSALKRMNVDSGDADV